ncbi:MAG TPA: ABC transporter substrate-binding protein [Chloroflexota bacterium]
MRQVNVFVLVLAAMLAAGCAPGSTTSGDNQSVPGAVDQNRTLVVAVRGEPSGLSDKEFIESMHLRDTKRFFNAWLTLTDAQGQNSPYLAEALPRLNTDTWRVLPDGRMETTYRLKPNLTWHDGAPLTADDFVFAGQVYQTTDLGFATTAPQQQMAEVTALDPRTVLITWNVLYPDAGTLSIGFEPLPRHILGTRFLELAPQAFVALPFWSREYVGLGPYCVDSWEPGAFVSGVAFDGHVLGRPKIGRLQVRFIPDTNAVVANLLAGAVNVSMDTSIGFANGATLEHEWAGTTRGSVLFTPSTMRWMQVQFRPELVNPKGLLDVRVRKALLQSLDRKALGDAMYDGQGKPLDAMVYPFDPWFPAVDRVITKYSFDLRQSEQLMADAGYKKDSDGTYANQADGRFVSELRISGGDENEREIAILAEAFRRAGFGTTEYPYPVTLTRDGEFRATFPGLLENPAGGGVASLISSMIPTAANRWTGSNRGGWSNPELDRFYDQFLTTLDADARNQEMAQAMKISTEQLPVLPIQYSFAVVAYTTGLRGPQSANSANWNIHQWEWT